MGTKEAYRFPCFIPKFRIASDQRVNLYSEMKGKGTPKHERIPFLRFTVLSGRTILNLEPSELNTLIQYAHNVCARTAWDAERLQGQKYGKKRKAKKVGRSFCKKSGFMRIEEAFFDTEGKKKGERVRRK